MDVRRVGTVLLAGAALAAASVLVVARTPVGAAPADSDTLVFAGYQTDLWEVVRNGQEVPTTGTRVTGQPVTGDFSAAPGTDVLVWGYRDAPDGIVHLEPEGTGVSTSVTPITVTGAYQPLVGDFDANGIDDVLWYGYGSSADALWLFSPDGTYARRSVVVNGHYQPVVVEATGDGYDDILWYASGSYPDSLWVHGPGATRTSRPLRIDGSYAPIVGHFRDTPSGASQEQVLWSSWEGPDVMWTFTAGGHTSRTLPGVDRAHPVVGDLLGAGRDAIFWYRSGRPAEQLTTFAPDGSPTVRPAPSVQGDYEPLVGDLDGNGREDIAWTIQGTAFVWTLDASGTGFTQTVVVTGHSFSVPLVVRTDPDDLSSPTNTDAG